MGTDLYIPHGINFPSGTDITQLESLDPAFEMPDIAVYSASEVLPGYTGSMFFSPVFNLSTTQIKDVLDKCTIDSVAAGYSSSNIDAEFRKVANLTGRASLAASSNVRLRAANSLLYWNTVGGRLGSLAEIGFTWQPISDGTNAPLVYAGSVALSTTSAVQSVFEVGPVTLNSSSLCIQGWSWNNNISPFPLLRCSGSPYVEFAAINRAMPTITLDVEDVTTAMGMLPAGTALSGLTAYLRKKAVSGINVANATAEHIEFSASVGTAKPIGPRQIKVMVHSFSIDTTAAIS